MRTIIFIVLFLLSTGLGAEENFEGIDKDVTIMSQILTGAFKADDQCKRCRIKAHYLAEQGVVFFISMPRVYGTGTRIGVGDLSDLDIPDVEGLEHIPAIVEEALASVQIELSGTDPYIYTGDNNQNRYITIRRVGRETLEAIREVRRERREIEREISEREIRLIHEDDDEVRREAQKEVAELEEKLAKVEAKEEKLETAVKKSRQEAQDKREKAMAEIRKAREAQQRSVETLVLQTFCDYGSTLRNLPIDEHVSLVFEDSREGDTVYVLKHDEIDQCSNGAEGLKASAIAYRFQPE